MCKKLPIKFGIKAKLKKYKFKTSYICRLPALFQRKAQWAYIPFLDKILVREQATHGIWNIDLIKLESNDLIISEFMHFGAQAKIKFRKQFTNN